MVTDKTIVTNLRDIDQIRMGDRKPYLIFIGGPSLGKVYVLNEGDTVIGRGQDAGILVEDESISRRHLSFHVDGPHVEVHDLESTNGTFVNGRRVKQCIIEDGDRIQISSASIMKFSFQDKLENIFHKELYRMAVTDPLTAIYNKRFFLDRIEEEFSHAKRGKQMLSLLIFDVDHFKQCNDQYGHLAGDFVLQRIAEQVLSMTRAGDIFARYGGEEFCLLLRQADQKATLTLSERIRHSIESYPFDYNGQNLKVTVSIGVAIYEPTLATSRVFIQEADRCLYVAKEKGRNRICLKDRVIQG